MADSDYVTKKDLKVFGAEIRQDVQKIVDKAVDDLSNVIFEFANNVDKRFKEVDQRFEKVDKRLDKMDQRLDKMDQRLDKMDQKFDIFTDKMEKISEENGRRLIEDAGRDGRITRLEKLTQKTA